LDAREAPCTLNARDAPLVIVKFRRIKAKGSGARRIICRELYGVQEILSSLTSPSHLSFYPIGFCSPRLACLCRVVAQHRLTICSPLAGCYSQCLRHRWPAIGCANACLAIARGIPRLMSCAGPRRHMEINSPALPRVSQWAVLCLAYPIVPNCVMCNLCLSCIPQGAMLDNP